MGAKGVGFHKVEVNLRQTLAVANMGRRGRKVSQISGEGYIARA